MASLLDDSMKIQWSTPRPGRFIPGKEPQYPFYRRVCGLQSQSGRFGEKYLTPAQIRTPECPAGRLTAVSTTLSQP